MNRISAVGLALGTINALVLLAPALSSYAAFWSKLSALFAGATSRTVLGLLAFVCGWLKLFATVGTIIVDDLLFAVSLILTGLVAFLAALLEKIPEGGKAIDFARNLFVNGKEIYAAFGLLAAFLHLCFFEVWIL